MFHCEKLVQTQEVKLTNKSVSPLLPPSPSEGVGPSGVFNTELFTLKLWQLVNYGSGLPTLALVALEVTVPVGCDSPYLPISVSSLADSSSPCALTSLMDLGRVIYLQCVKLIIILTTRREWHASYVQDWK